MLLQGIASLRDSFGEGQKCGLGPFVVRVGQPTERTFIGPIFDTTTAGVVEISRHQQAVTLTARPPSEVSLYLSCMSAPVCRMVSIT